MVTKNVSRRSQPDKGGRAPYRPKEEVREQILAAAEELFADHMPTDVSIRDIAERAGVQHSLVHRHFQTKEALLAEVLTRTIDRYAAVAAAASDPADGFVRGMDYMADHPTEFVTVVSAFLDHQAAADERRIFPGFEVHLREFLAAGAPDSVDTRVLVLTLMALTSGWAFLEDRWLAVGGLEAEGKEAVRGRVADLVRRLVADSAS